MLVRKLVPAGQGQEFVAACPKSPFGPDAAHAEPVIARAPAAAAHDTAHLKMALFFREAESIEYA
ncbi:MAG: hypothetical protein C4318_04395 [Acidimicrobiia bacterium]